MNVWSDQETQVVVDLFRRGVGGGDYTGRVREVIPMKTAKQIRNKVALLRQQGVIPRGFAGGEGEQMPLMEDSTSMKMMIIWPPPSPGGG